jgi:hypothetical protein
VTGLSGKPAFSLLISVAAVYDRRKACACFPYCNLKSEKLGNRATEKYFRASETPTTIFPRCGPRSLYPDDVLHAITRSTNSFSHNSTHRCARRNAADYSIPKW